MIIKNPRSAATATALAAAILVGRARGIFQATGRLLK